MIRLSQLPLELDAAADADRQRAALFAAVCRRLNLPEHSPQLREVWLRKRAIDARRAHEVRFACTVDAELDPEAECAALAAGLAQPTPDESYADPVEGWGEQTAGLQTGAAGSGRPGPRVIVVGTGPCGLFCGLQLARAGWRPLLLERGKAVGPRARDVTGFWRRGTEFQPDSNVQFGEGGAGTFSDGKLYTQIRDREHRIPWLLREMVRLGAPEDILVKARPHVGTDRLGRVVRGLRAEIESHGGEVRFGSRVDDVLIEQGRVRGVVLADGSQLECEALVLAVGHSARDTFEVLLRRGVRLTPKPFSVGVRIEHPQGWIDRIQHGARAGHPLLGSAPYKFACKTRSGAVAYSFCMCPGGLVVAANSEPGQVVTNGMSSYARAEANANAGFMVEVGPEHYTRPGDDVLAGVRFQRELETRAFAVGGGDYRAPAQRLGDFMRGRPSRDGGGVEPSYLPGVVWGDVREVLPAQVADVLRDAVPRVDRQLRGFALEDAVMTAVETRSSSPVRIERDPGTLQSVNVGGLYPAGEGAGYAGGIISAAVDGLRIAEVLLGGSAE